MIIPNHKVLKELIELSTTIEQVDNLLDTYTKYETIPEKIAFLDGMFDIKIIDEQPGDRNNEDVYKMILHVIVNKKFL